MQGLHEPPASAVSVSNGLPRNQMDRKSLVGFIKSCQNLKDLKKARRIVNQNELYNSKDMHVSTACLVSIQSVAKWKMPKSYLISFL